MVLGIRKPGRMVQEGMDYAAGRIAQYESAFVNLSIEEIENRLKNRSTLERLSSYIFFTDSWCKDMVLNDYLIKLNR